MSARFFARPKHSVEIQVDVCKCEAERTRDYFDASDHLDARSPKLAQKILFCTNTGEIHKLDSLLHLHPQIEWTYCHFN